MLVVPVSFLVRDLRSVRFFLFELAMLSNWAEHREDWKVVLALQRSRVLYDSLADLIVTRTLSSSYGFVSPRTQLGDTCGQSSWRWPL